MAIINTAKENNKAKPAKKAKEAPKVHMLTGAADIQKAISSIALRGKKLEQDVHSVAVSVLMHADKHGDITLANKLVQALPDLTRKNALKDWLIAFGKFSYDAKSKALVFNKQAVTNEKQAVSVPFWTFKPEAEYVPFNMIASLNALWRKAQAAKAKGDAVPDALLGQLAGLITAAEGQALRTMDTTDATAPVDALAV